MRLNKKLTIDQKNQLQQMVFVGRLATKEELSLTMIDQSIIFSDTSNRITFYIKCLSEVPEEIERNFEYKNQIFTANTNSYRNLQLIENHGVDFDSFIERQEQVPKLFEDKLIIFSLDPKDTIIYADMESLEPNKPLKRYFSLPSPKLKTNETKNDLHHKLVEERRPIILDRYPSIVTPSPELIIYEDFIYHVDLESKGNPTTYFQNDLSQVKYIELSDSDADYFLDYMHDDFLYFISMDKYGELKDRIEEKGNILNEEMADDEAQKDGNHEQLIDSAQELTTSESGPGLLPLEKNKIDSEIEFLEKFKYIVKQKYRLFYNEDDLINFHTSVKTNAITILGGMSGTGKSQLARAYADALELSEDNYIFIPISPSYQEPGDVLGYLNPQTGVFYESDTGLVNLLLKAEEDPKNLYMVIFDEMNLSQVEHWFSPFLSLLELKENRNLSLFNENNRVINGKYKAEINLYDNLIFVGTVNFDETTKAFSDRLLDRINIIVPRKAKFKDTINFYEEINDKAEGEFNDVPINRNVMRDTWVYNKNVGLNYLNDPEIYILDELHELINKNDPQKGVSFRVALSIVEYLMNLPKQSGESLISKREAFDHQINQRILTKINGIDSFVEPLVGYYTGNEYTNGSISELLSSEEAKKASDFELSLKTLKNKAKELSVYGFAN